MRLSQLISAILITGLAVGAIAGTDAIPPRMKVAAPPASTRSTVAPPVRVKPYLPKIAAPITARELAPVKAASQPAPVDQPALLAVAGTPERPGFGQGQRILITPTPPLTPHIPNLLVSPRKAQFATGNPIVNPAAAISTPPVNNVDGTDKLALLQYFTREITVEIAPPAGPLSLDQEPYLQAPNAPDDQDPPASISALPARAALK